MRPTTTYILIWLFASSIAVFLAFQLSSASFVDGQYIPAGNDSFYHARRILDTAIGERGFYQFDDMIHVPEGSWLNWPWAYDYLVAMALSFALWLRPAMDPMAFLAHVPVAWIFVNMGLLTLVVRKIELGAELGSAALLGFALLPLTQTLHGVGIIDHHFIELTFVLVTVWTGLNFFAEKVQPKDAVWLGVVLGIAPAFHNGLFILQIPVLVCLLVQWLRGRLPDPRNHYWFAAALVGSTLLVSLPSAAFRDMQFEFWTLSWFHLYIACSSAISALFLGLRPCNRMNASLLAAMGALLVIPLFARILTGAAFLSGDLLVLDQIAEVRSPVSWISSPGGFMQVSNFYSWLFFLTPVLIFVAIRHIWQDFGMRKLYLSVFSIFGLLLMLTQFRLHPFGAWALVVGSMLILQYACERYLLSKLAMVAVSLMVILVAFQPPLRNQLFENYAPGISIDYAATRSLFSSLSRSCAEEGGVALGYHDDGHYIRYHTDCSVITNNFLLTPLHAQKIKEADRLLQLDPTLFLQAAPHVNYIFVRMYGIFETGPDGTTQATPISTVASRNAPLFVALTFDEDLPSEYQLVDEVRVQDERNFAYARVFKIVRNL